MVDPRIYRLVVEQARDYAVFVLHPDGRVMTWSAGAERMKGYRAEEIVGQHFSVFYPREEVERGLPDYELKLAVNEGRFQDEGWRVRKDGTRFWASVSLTALRDEEGHLLGFSKITRDLTKRRLQDEALRQSEERFRLLVEGVTDYAIFMLDPEGVVTSWNSGAERITGYRRDDILGRHYSVLFTEEDRAAARPWESLVVAQRTGRAEHEGWRVRRDGTHFWACSIVTALRDPDGRLRGYAKITQDLTERRHIENLERAAQNVNEFIAVLAHELRNPLAPIRSAVQVMARLPAGDPAQQTMRETIDRQSAHLMRIVDDMVDISRISRGVLSMEFARVDLVEVARTALETVLPALEEARHALEAELPPAPLWVRGDHDRLVQLVTNLLTNAVRYTPRGGRVALGARPERGRALLAVRDSGRGIDPAHIERIFDMFVQGRPPLQRVGGGLGVGLALARRIAQLHGGRLEAFSEGANRGSTFTLTLPLFEGQVAAPRKPATRRPAERDVRHRVLVVDDNVDAARTLSLVLQSLGHETAVVHDGAQALERVDTFEPDIVLLDIGMPGLDGYEVARRLRARRTKRPLRIVAVTGWGHEADIARGREAGFDEHLVKPVDPEKLASALRGGATLH